MIPLLDWTEAQTDRPAFTAKLGKAVRETGFILLANPQVPQDLRDKVFDLADAFFSQPRAEKAKLSILDTAITSWDATKDGPDERLEGRAFIAALSGENASKGIVYTSRMDVEDSEISYLGNEGDYHNDIGALPLFLRQRL